MPTRQSLGLWWGRAYATLSGRIAIEGFRFVQRETTETCLASRDPEGAEHTGPAWR
jgi:hypothetical protein